MSRFMLGVDIGGTFTDFLLIDPDAATFRVAKVATTPADQSLGFMDGRAALGAPMEMIETIVHGTTIGTNAILERKGVACGLITTRGFRDVLELGRRTRPNPYGMIGSFEPLIRRELRAEVTDDRAPRPLRRGDGAGGDRRTQGAFRAADARAHRRGPRWRLRILQLHRQRRHRR